ncbi:MAG: polysaccharide biosynthesis tyrosine autokinase [Clostridiales bacterium]|nr:polysaccharide biosynthesis tyrosine autokinase [Clostridiales bacterium]
MSMNKQPTANDRQAVSIDLIKLAKFLLKYCWLILLCAAVGFCFMQWRSSRVKVADTYTAAGTMYVYNSNPNMINYGYASASDIKSAVTLLDTYMEVVKSNKVLDVVAERLAPDYPTITPSQIRATLSMTSVNETGVVSVRCTTTDPQQSADICNAVMDVAPAEIIRVVGAGSIEIIDYATVPTAPNGYSPAKKNMIGALVGAAAAAAVLFLIFLLDSKVRDASEMEERYTLPVLSSIHREKKESRDPSEFRLTGNSPMDQLEGYAKLRMNLMYTLVGKEKCSVMITSAISGEGKSTIAANLAISIAMSGKRVLLVDADMRRACQRRIFHYSGKNPGLSDVLVGNCPWQNALISTDLQELEILPAGTVPPNPTEMLDSPAMHALLPQLEQSYDMVILDAPPVNVVSDAFALASSIAGSLFVVRQRYTDHRDVRKALRQAELGGLELLGFVFYGEKLDLGGSRKYYDQYYHKYDTRRKKDAHRPERDSEKE